MTQMLDFGWTETTAYLTTKPCRIAIDRRLNFRTGHLGMWRLHERLRLFRRLNSVPCRLTPQIWDSDVNFGGH